LNFIVPLESVDEEVTNVIVAENGSGPDG